MANRSDESWKNNLIERLRKPTERGDYRRALAIARIALKSHPKDETCRYLYAKLLGDYADELALAKKKKLKREAVRILKPLLRKPGSLTPEQLYGAKLNFFYQSENFRGMYAFGRRIRNNVSKSAYTCGLAAALLADELNAKGARKKSRNWAKKSVSAWKKYDLKNERYYFAHYTYAKALALADQTKEAAIALKRAARLAKRPVTDWEFADVRRILEQKSVLAS